MNKVRQSNFELLRIVAIFMVLIVHANFGKFYLPSIEEATICPGVTWFRAFAHMGVSFSVNLFILISGWFLIRLKARSVLNLFYLIVFWRSAALFVSVWSGDAKLTLSSIAIYLNPMRMSFIKDYITLMIFSPVINVFCEKCTTKEIGRYLVLYYAIVMVADHLLPLKVWGLFSGGYNWTAYIGLYVLGHYLRRVSNYFDAVPKRYFLYVFAAVVIFGSVAYACVLCYYDLPLRNRILWSLQTYTSPVVLCGSISLFLYFSRLQIHSKVINHIALSVFPVFLFHCIFLYQTVLNDIESKYHSGFVSVTYMMLFIILVFVVTVIGDQVRIVTWRLLDHTVGKMLPVMFSSRRNGKMGEDA